MGLFFARTSYLGWRHRNEESISLLEASILKVTSAEPLPLTKFDRWLQRAQLVLITLFAPPMILIGGYGLLSELGVV